MSKKEYDELYCPRCGEPPTHLQPWLQDRSLKEEPQFYGLDVYCQNCGFSGDIRPDDLDKEELEELKPKGGWE